MSSEVLNCNSQDALRWKNCTSATATIAKCHCLSWGGFVDPWLFLPVILPAQSGCDFMPWDLEWFGSKHQCHYHRLTWKTYPCVVLRFRLSLCWELGWWDCFAQTHQVGGLQKSVSPTHTAPKKKRMMFSNRFFQTTAWPRVGHQAHW